MQGKNVVGARTEVAKTLSQDNTDMRNNKEAVSETSWNGAGVDRSCRVFRAMLGY